MHHLKEVDMLSAKLDLLMKKLDDRGGDKKEVMHVYDSHMTCEECGDTGHSGNHCPKMLEDVNYINNYYYYYYNNPYYSSLTTIQGWASCRFFIGQFIVFGDISRELLCKEVKPKASVHMNIKPHVDKPPRASQIADGFT